MEAVGGIEHPNVVWATDAGDHDGTPYIVMEYLAGETLQQVLAANGPLRIADACELVRQAAVGLGCIHDRRMVHRDVKPSNLLLTVDGVVKLLDFGLVRLAEGSGVGEELTAAATARGTPDYIAPEQASDSRSVDCRADIYGLGCTLYELLTGMLPFAGSEHDTAVKKLLCTAKRRLLPCGLPGGMCRWNYRSCWTGCWPKSPTDRPGSAAEVIAVLTPLTTGNRLPALLKASAQAVGSPRAPLPPTAVAPGSSASTLNWTRPAGRHSRHRWRSVTLAAVLIAAPLIGFALWRVWNPPQQVAKDENVPGAAAVAPLSRSLQLILRLRPRCASPRRNWPICSGPWRPSTAQALWPTRKGCESAWWRSTAKTSARRNKLPLPGSCHVCCGRLIRGNSSPSRRRNSNPPAINQARRRKSWWRCLAPVA